MQKTKKNKFGKISDISFRVKNTLLEQIIEDKIAQSYLFYGPGRKDKTARAFAKILLCKGKKKPCHGVCCQMFDRGIQSDFIVLEKEKKDTKIKIEKVREIRRNVSMRAAGRRVVLIRRAELLSGDAANALLKTLEEPTSQTIFILTTSNIKEVIPTIISRCQGFYLMEEAENYQNHDREKKIIEFLKSDLISRFALSKEIGEKKDEGLKFLNDIERILRLEMLEEESPNKKKEVAREIKNITKSRLLFKRNISARLILEDLSLRLKKRE